MILKLNEKLSENIEGEERESSPVERMLKKIGIKLNSKLIEEIRQNSPMRGYNRTETSTF